MHAGGSGIFIRRSTPARLTRKTRAARRERCTLEDGDFVTVIGGNGAGKSTLLNAVAGVWPVDEGRYPDRRRGRDAPARVQARQVHRPRVSGSHDGHRRRHVDRGKHGAVHAPRPAAARCAPALRAPSARSTSAMLASAGPGSGRPHDQQGRPAVRRSASGADAAYGLAVSAPSSYCWTSTPPRSTPRPRPRCWTPPTALCSRDQPDHADDHAQHAATRYCTATA